MTRLAERAAHDREFLRLDDWIIPAAGRTAQTDAETRNRVDAPPAIVAALREGRSVTAPGYDTTTRGAGAAVAYDPTGCPVILLDGGFVAHPSVWSMLDLAVFVDLPEAAQRAQADLIMSDNRGSR